MDKTLSTAETPLVSVIIPAFNVAHIIQETLDSVRAQTFQDFEVIVNVDNGSTDDTAAVIRRFCEQDSRFVMLTQPHSVISEARNKALEHARGELIAFLDADDFWLPEKLARQTAMFLEDPQMNLSFTNFCSWDGRHELSVFYHDHKPLPEGNAVHRLIFANPFGMSTVMVRRGLLQLAGAFDPAMEACEDWDLWLRLNENGLRARGTRQPLARYRVWANNASKHKLRTVRHDVRVLEKNLRLSKHPEWQPLYQRSLTFARSKLELTLARQRLETEPQKIPVAIWRAWRLDPRQLKWLIRYLLVAWPKFLGGHMTERIVHRKLVKKF